jgi:hypothetical protein
MEVPSVAIVFAAEVLVSDEIFDRVGSDQTCGKIVEHSACLLKSSKTDRLVG